MMNDRLTAYKAFIRRVAARGRCESCGHLPAEVGQRQLHVHHLMHVAAIGLDDPAVVDEGNVLLLCNACHALFHPLKRHYDWKAAGRNRGIRL